MAFGAGIGKPRVRVEGLRRAVDKLDRHAKQDMRVLKKELESAAKTMQKEVAADIAKTYNLPISAAKRRVRYFRGDRRRKFDLVVGISLSNQSNVVHSGRIKGLRRGRGKRKNKVTYIPGVGLAGKNAFLFRPDKYNPKVKGGRNGKFPVGYRVYSRKQGDRRIVAVNHPDPVVAIIERHARVRAPVLLARALRNARRAQRGSLARAFIGDATATIR